MECFLNHPPKKSLVFTTIRVPGVWLDIKKLCYKHKQYLFAKNQVTLYKANKLSMFSLSVSSYLIIAVYFQFKQLERRSLKKIRASTGFKPVTSKIPVRCSTN